MATTWEKRLRKPESIVGRGARVFAWGGTKWIVLVLWLGVLGVMTPIAGRLPEAEQNDAAAWLPENAEALRVEEILQGFPQGEALPAVVVYHRAAGLSPLDLERVEEDHQRLAQEFGDITLSAINEGQDGQTAFYVLPLAYEEGRVLDQVSFIRRQLATDEDLLVHVTGPAGVQRDMAGMPSSRALRWSAWTCGIASHASSPQLPGHCLMASSSGWGRSPKTFR